MQRHGRESCNNMFRICAYISRKLLSEWEGKIPVLIWINRQCETNVGTATNLLINCNGSLSSPATVKDYSQWVQESWSLNCHPWSLWNLRYRLPERKRSSSGVSFEIYLRGGGGGGGVVGLSRPCKDLSGGHKKIGLTFLELHKWLIYGYKILDTANLFPL